jgi:putative ABC transport system permease protein
MARIWQHKTKFHSMKYALLLFARNLKRQKLFSFINLLGLTISVIGTLLIYLYVQFELSYDSFHKHADRIYRVNQTFIWGENNNHQFASTGPGVAHALQEELPEVELMTSIYTPGNFLVSYTHPSNQVISFEQERVLAADSNFLAMFNFPLLEGHASSALSLGNTLVMTERIAKKYFGEDNAVGKLVRVGIGENEKTYEVTGVLKDLPENSYLQFDMLLAMESFPIVERMNWSWVWTQLETFIRVRENTSIEQTCLKLAGIPRKHAEETLQRAMHMSFDQYVKSGKNWELFLQPITAIHLPTTIVYNRINQEVGNIKIIYSLIGAATFIVILSCINFMNLSTAQFTRRVKEASLRKMLGLDRRELISYYFLEAFLYSLLAMVLGIALLQSLLPIFNFLSGKHLSLAFFSNPSFMLSLIALMAIMSLLSGSYPAIFLSRFNPIEGIKGKLRTGASGKVFRNTLVTFQFSISILLILCTTIVFQQLNYVNKRDVGFNKENLLVLKGIERIPEAESLTQSLATLPNVSTSSLCTSLPPTVFGGDTFRAEGQNTSFPLNFTTIDRNFLPTLGITLRTGRNFEADNVADDNKVILNETAVKRIGWKMDETTLGKRIAIEESYFEVIGIAKDFNYWTLQAPIEPLGLFHHNNTTLAPYEPKKFIVMKVRVDNPSALTTTLTTVEKLWKIHGRELPLQYEFVDDAFASTFKEQEQFGKALVLIAALAILIACMGLLGMIVYSLEQRTKEIGIRKISGASTFSILTLIARGYTKLIILAFFISAPTSYWLMQIWLSDFAFRVAVSPVLFGMVGIGTLVIAILVTSYHAVKASMLNPVDVLRNE